MGSIIIFCQSKYLENLIFSNGTTQVFSFFTVYHHPPKKKEISTCPCSIHWRDLIGRDESIKVRNEILKSPFPCTIIQNGIKPFRKGLKWVGYKWESMPTSSYLGQVWHCVDRVQVKYDFHTLTQGSFRVDLGFGMSDMPYPMYSVYILLRFIYEIVLL